MNKKLIATLAGALVLPASMVARADVMGDTDFTIYGRVVAGVDWQDSDKDGESATWDIGATGKNGTRNQQSRLGFKADRDLGNGLTAGMKLEQGFDADSGPNNQRHRYVYLSGGFGTVTIGNQNNPYLMGANWAQEWYLGGNTVGSFREEGIGYSNSWGNFSLGVLLTGNNGEHVTIPARTNPAAVVTPQETVAAYLARVQAAAGRVSDNAFTVPDQNTGESEEDYADRLRGLVNAVTAADKDIAVRTPMTTETNDAHRIRLAETAGLAREEGADGAAETDAAFLARIQNEGETNADFLARIQREARNADTAAINAAEATNRVADETIDRTIIGASYDFGPVKLGVGYNGDNTDNDYNWTSIGVSGSLDRFSYYLGFQQKDDARPGGSNDQDGWGTFVSYDMSGADRVYLEYESLENDYGNNDEATYTILGYSHNFGGGVRFIGEYRTSDDDATDEEPSRLALTMMVGF